MEILERRGGTTPKGLIYLLDCAELSSDYSNTWFFDNLLQQQQYFQTKIQKTFTGYSYLRKEQAIKIQCHIDDIHSSNYVMYANKDSEYVYAFIIEKEYINENTTKIYIQTDLIQTYFFNFVLKDSFVDRCHVDRWTQAGNPTNEIENEGLEFGEYIQESSEDVYELKDSFVAVCSSPLGKIKYRKKSDPDVPSGGSSGDWEKGIISSNGFRFIKGFEGFAPRKYLDTLAVPNVWTIGYGITETSEKDAYDYLDQRNPATEEDCAKVSYYIKNERYGKRIINSCKEMGVTRQGQFDALLSFAYNLGTGYFKAGNKIYDTIKKDPNNEKAVREAFTAYNRAGGKPEPGLTERRNQECDMFFDKPVKYRPILIVKAMGQYEGTFKGDGWLPS